MAFNERSASSVVEDHHYMDANRNDHCNGNRYVNVEPRFKHVTESHLSHERDLQLCLLENQLSQNLKGCFILGRHRSNNSLKFCRTLREQISSLPLKYQ